MNEKKERRQMKKNDVPQNKSNLLKSLMLPLKFLSQQKICFLIKQMFSASYHVKKGFCFGDPVYQNCH